MEQSTKVLTDVLRSARIAAGLSQRALSAKLGIPQSRLSRIESGAIDIRTSTLLDLARALGMEPILIPRRLVPAVSRLTEDAALAGTEPTPRPLYRLDEGHDDG